MRTDLFYYTGTGNSLWAARTLAGLLDNAEILPIARLPEDWRSSTPDAIGLIFPVHVWGLPARVIDFAAALTDKQSAYSFAIAVNAGQVAATLLQLEKLLLTKGITLSAGFDLVMPSNYIPWGGPGPIDKQRQRFHSAREKLARIAATVEAREKRPVEKGPLWQNIFFTRINKMTFPRISAMDKSFWSDTKCNACGICRRVCPSSNINLSAEGKPVWQHRCEQCLACLQWCPRESIQFGKRTPRYERYHHPDVKLREMITDPP